jgi:GGDEF domain-containing protein
LFRRVERAVRFGGDEFIVIYQDGTDLDEAEEVGSLILGAPNALRDGTANSANIGGFVNKARTISAVISADAFRPAKFRLGQQACCKPL